MEYKEIISACVGAAGAFFTSIFGCFDTVLQALIVFMTIDVMTGLIAAAVFGESTKTDGGGLESRAAQKGLIRKVAIIALVAASFWIDNLLGTDYIRNAVALGFCVSEVISIVENVGLMGVTMPAAITKALEVLKIKAGENAEAIDESEEGDGE